MKAEKPLNGDKEGGEGGTVKEVPRTRMVTAEVMVLFLEIQQYQEYLNVALDKIVSNYNLLGK